MANEHTAFWLELLTFGDSEDEKKKYWNYYVFWSLHTVISGLLGDDQMHELTTKLPYPQNHDEESLVKHNEPLANLEPVIRT